MPLVGIRDIVAHAFGRRGIFSIVALLVIGALLVAACAAPPVPNAEVGTEPGPGFFPIPPATEQGTNTFLLYPLVFFIAVAVFLLVEGLLLWIVFRYRRRPTDEALPAQTHGNNLLEVLWTAIPALIVAGLFVLTVDNLARIENRSESGPQVTIDVTGFQWQWTFDYQEQGLSFTGVGAEGPVMALPVNEPVLIRLHATDVIHSFYVPQFLYKKDVVPGRVNEFEVTVKEPGVYAGQCAEFCGLAHYDMRFTVEALTRPDFDAWVAQNQQGTQPTLPPDGGATVTLTSVDINTFEPATLNVPADTEIVFDFVNADQTLPHNVAIVGAAEDGTDWIGLPIAQAGQSATYVAPPLAAGSYEFYCSVHPTTMRGVLNVGE